MRAIVLVVAIAGCAHVERTPTATPTTRDDPALKERAAVLFDAALEDDRLRLKAMVDWPRYRTLHAWRRCVDDACAARALAELEAEPQPTAGYLDAAVIELAQSLRTVASGALPPQRLPGSIAVPPPRRPATSPSLARLDTYAGEALQGTTAIAYAGAARVILVFAGGQLAAALDGK